MASRTFADLKHRVAFDKRSVVDDGYGNTVGGWAEQFRAYADFAHRGGSETVQAARLEGRNLIGVHVRSSSQTRQVAVGWQMRDVHRGTAYNVTHVDAVTDRDWVYIEAQSGGATG